MYFFGTGGWSPQRVVAEMHAEAWHRKEHARLQRASDLASQGREVFMVDETDPDWVYD